MRYKFNIIKKSIIACLLAVILAFSFAVAAVATVAEYDIDGEAEAIFAELCRMAGAEDLEDWVVSYLAPRAGDGAEWYIIALRQAHPEVDLSAYADALEARMDRGEIKGAVARQRCALAMAACGRGNSAAVSAVMDETIGAMGIMSNIFGLNLMNAGVTSRTHTVDDIIDSILAAILDGGGWAVMGAAPDADVTAMAVQALAPHRERRADVAAAVDTATEYLISAMRESGTYLSYGVENPESAAQAAMAFVSCGIDPERDSRMAGRRTLIDGIFAFRLAGEGFSHQAGGGYNATATVQSLLALISVSRARRGLGGIYVFEENGDITVPSAPISSKPQMPETDIPSVETSGGAVTDTAAVDTLPSPTGGSESLKLYMVAGILVAACAAALVLWILGRRHKKNFIFIAAVAAVLTAAVFLVDIRTAEDYYADTTSDIGAPMIEVSISVHCGEALGVVERDGLPSDGVILAATRLEIREGGTVLDALVEAARLNRLQLEYSGSGSMAYVLGIEYLYEFDGGDLSGWIYRVNGVSPSVGCGGLTLSDGDVIEWEYTLVPEY